MVVRRFNNKERRVVMPTCQKCGDKFPFRVLIDGKQRNLKSRKYCLQCSPFGNHNTKNLHNIPELPEVEPLAHSEELAYLIGAISGDGSISHCRSNTYKLSIVCDNRYPDLIDQYMKLVERVIGGNIHIYWRKHSNCADIYTYRSRLPTLLGLPYGTKSQNGYFIPEWIYSSVPYVRCMLRGLMETDGGVYRIYKKGGWFWHCAFTAYYEPIMQGFLRGADMLGYSFIRYGKTLRLTHTFDVKRWVAELGLNKIREYVYNDDAL
jgi:hypothetical protein